MNVFRLCGDLSHLLAIVILLMKIWKTRSCSGISGKTQALFALVFVTRYLDLFVHFVSLYNTGFFYSVKTVTNLNNYSDEANLHFPVNWHMLPDLCQVQGDL